MTKGPWLSLVICVVGLAACNPYVTKKNVDDFFREVEQTQSDADREKMFRFFLDSIRAPESAEDDKVMVYFWRVAANYFVRTQDSALLNAVDSFDPGGGVFAEMCYFLELISATDGFQARLQWGQSLF